MTAIDKVQLEQAIDAAYAADGYVTPDGVRDKQKVRDRIFDILAANKVSGLKERADKASSRGALVEQVFPSLPDADDQDDLGREVRKELGKFVWGECTTGASSKMQRMVGENMGNGYVLCRTKIGRDTLDAAYITTDRQCIERDFVTPSNDALARRVKAVLAEREMLIRRQPAHGQRWMRSIDQQMRQLQSAGHEQLALALESVKATTNDETVEDETETDSTAA